ncbi:hypothetical protein Malapachy_1445 [Malassezia pachydermatis]|uniref:Uncharacterized protein n=1 Tax=Malassezia pachydermatis TaxID=77020 RepID=A0A0M8MT85_9BASI|nr:hypothetical protein Malapachy_1445 [Malassezia pachydermatis]KOS13151.1 hypothetical protein Malapachy_1445 [Malassezia pachydermatis]
MAFASAGQTHTLTLTLALLLAAAQVTGAPVAGTLHHTLLARQAESIAAKSTSKAGHHSHSHKLASKHSTTSSADALTSSLDAQAPMTTTASVVALPHSSTTHSTMSRAAHVPPTKPRTLTSAPSHHLSAGAIAGIIVAVLAVCIVLAVIGARWWCQRRRKSTGEVPSKEADPQWTMSEKGLPALPTMRPLMSTVSRGTLNRFQSYQEKPPLRPSPEPAQGPIYPGHVSRLSGGDWDGASVNSKHMSAYSLDSKHSGDTQHLRQSNLHEPCVTHGAGDWVIHAYEEMDDEEHVVHPSSARDARV